jgi:ankyrin repeat protein
MRGMYPPPAPILTPCPPAVHLQDPQGFTPLMLAARGGKVACVELLLSRRADPSLTAANGLDARALASVNGRTELLTML